MKIIRQQKEKQISIYLDIRENQFFLNEFPNDACHFITVHFDNRLGSGKSLGWGCICYGKINLKNQIKSN